MTATKTRSKPKTKNATKKPTQAKKSQADRVHPKISERRSGVAKDRSRRRSHTIFILGFISMIAVIALAVLESPLFNVAEVNASGHVRATPAEIVEASGISVGSQLSDIDKDLAAQSVVEASPWVKSAEVDRSWNGIVTIYVVERSPVLAVRSRATSEALMLVDETGRQLVSVTDAPAGVVVVEGVTVSGVAGQPSGIEILRAASIADGLSDPVRAMTRGVSVEDGMVRLMLDDGARIAVGDQSLLEEKMIAVETLFARVDMRCLHEIDVRVPAAPTVTRQTRDGQPRAIVEDLGQCL